MADEAMVGRDGCDDEQQQVVLTLRGGAWYGWLSCWFLVWGLGSWSARQGWAAVMLCARHWASVGWLNA